MMFEVVSKDFGYLVPSSLQPPRGRAGRAGLEGRAEREDEGAPDGERGAAAPGDVLAHRRHVPPGDRKRVRSGFVLQCIQ